MSAFPGIIIIDDDEEVRVATENLVQSYGLEAHGFASAEDYLRSPYLEVTACLITDVQMPGMSGVDLQNVLIAQGRNVPIVFITAFPEERLRHKVLADGALGFLGKPFEAGALMDCIHMALAMSSRAGSGPTPA